MKARILVVDDEQSARTGLERLLKQEGYTVELAADGPAALAAAADQSPDMVITDLKMPGMDGLELIAKLRETHPDLPVIVATAFGDVSSAVEAMRAGADDYITKPFNFSEVLARIRAVLRTRELVGQIERREARIGVVEAMSEKLLAFADGIRGPLASLARDAAAVAPECGSAKPFVEKALEEAKTALAKLDDLDSAVASLKAEADSLKEAETALPALKRTLRS